MPKKNANVIKGLGNRPNDYIVQKSYPLWGLWHSSLTLPEFKILDAYLSRIDSHHPEKRTVHFEKGDLERYLGVKKINASDLKKRLKNLMTAVEMSDPKARKGVRLITLFEESVCYPDENGVWEMDLTCTQSAMKYIFNIEQLGYLRYTFRSIAVINSRYSYILFLYLEKNRHMHLTWDVEVSFLKTLLGVDNSDYYKEFKSFNQKILKRCQKELYIKTMCHFDYKTIKRGRVVTSIRITLIPLPLLSEKNSDDVFELGEKNEKQLNYHQEYMGLYHQACSIGNGNPEFSDVQMEQIFQILITVPSYKLPLDSSENIEIRRYHYLRERYAAMNVMAEKKKIVNRFNYFVTLIKNDAKED